MAMRYYHVAIVRLVKKCATSFPQIVGRNGRDIDSEAFERLQIVKSRACYVFDHPPPACNRMSLVNRFEHGHDLVKVIADDCMEAEVVLCGEEAHLARFVAGVDLLDKTGPPRVRQIIACDASDHCITAISD